MKKIKFSGTDLLIYAIVLLIILAALIAYSSGIIGTGLFIILLFIAIAPPFFKFIIQPYVLGNRLKQEQEKLKLKRDIFDIEKEVKAKLIQHYKGLTNSALLPNNMFIIQKQGVWVGYYNPKDVKRSNMRGAASTDLPEGIVEYDLYSNKVVAFRSEEQMDAWERKFYERAKRGYWLLTEQKMPNIILPEETEHQLKRVAQAMEEEEKEKKEG